MRRAGTALAVAALFCAPLVVGAEHAARGADDAATTSPIVSVAPDTELNCTTSSTRSDWLQFFSFMQFPPTLYSCATVVSVQGFGLFGPSAFADSDGTISGTPLHPYAPV